MLLRRAWLVVGAAPFSGSLAASTCTNQSFCMGGRHWAPPSHCHALCARKPARTIVSRFFQFKRRCTRLPTSKRCISATLPALHFQPPHPELVDTSCCGLKLTAQTTWDVQSLLGDVIWYLASHENAKRSSKRPSARATRYQHSRTARRNALRWRPASPRARRTAAPEPQLQEKRGSPCSRRTRPSPRAGRPT